MQRSVRCGFGVILLSSLALVISACNGGVRASQDPTLPVSNLTQSNLTQSNLTQLNLATGGGAIGTLETDCEQLAKLSMAAEVQAMGVQYSWQSSPSHLDQNIQELQRSVAQIQAIPMRSVPVDQLRVQYVSLLQSVIQATQPTASGLAQDQSGQNAQSEQLVRDRVNAAAKLRRDRIFFASCK
jgi:hypothetical protein